MSYQSLMKSPSAASKTPNLVPGPVTRHRSWSHFSLPWRNVLKELFLFLSLPFASIQGAAVPLLVSYWVQDPSLRVEHPLALLHPSHPAGSGCVHLLMAQHRVLCVSAGSLWREDGNWIKTQGRVCSTQYPAIGEGRVMTKQRGPEDFLALIAVRRCAPSPTLFTSISLHLWVIR